MKCLSHIYIYCTFKESFRDAEILDFGWKRDNLMDIIKTHTNKNLNY